MSKGFIVDSGKMLAYGYDGPGTKIERLKASHEFVTSASDKPRYDVLLAEMQTPARRTPNPDKVPIEILVRALKDRGVLTDADLA